jgi:hypothetical protein
MLRLTANLRIAEERPLTNSESVRLQTHWVPFGNGGEYPTAATYYARDYLRVESHPKPVGRSNPGAGQISER